MARVPTIQKRPVDPLEEIIGPTLDLTCDKLDGNAAKAFLAELDRQLGVIDAKKSDKNGNYE